MFFFLNKLSSNIITIIHKGYYIENVSNCLANFFPDHFAEILPVFFMSALEKALKSKPEYISVTLKSIKTHK